jgi:hypothetical protein
MHTNLNGREETLPTFSQWNQEGGGGGEDTRGQPYEKEEKKCSRQGKNLAEKTKARSLLNISTGNRKRIRVVG